MNALISADEEARLQALEEYQLLDSVVDEAFDRITRLASAMLQAPISCISFIEKDRQWFGSHLGLDVSQTARDASFCAHAILQDDVFVVPDATLDTRFCDNPHVTGEPYIRFYAGAPLKTFEGHKLGTLCVIDRIARDIGAGERRALTDLAAMVMDVLDMRRLASIDALTRACNRQFFTELGDKEIARTARHGLALSLLMIDADDFKVLNDTYGHHAGDAALRHLAERTRAKLRPQDVLGRIGGEEFAVLLPHTARDGAGVVAERLRHNIAKTPVRFPDQAIGLTVSIGASTFTAGDTLKSMLRRADRALYEAKAGGRDRVVMA